MTIGVAGLVAAYVLLAALLAALLLFTRWAWWLKAAMVTLVTGFYLVTYYSIPPLLGWPTTQPLPRRFNLIAAWVQEPDKVSGAPGEIYLWATDITGDPHAHRPRAYALPFTPELHASVAEAAGKLKKNLPQLGEVEGDANAPIGRLQDAWRVGQKSTAIKFYDLPDPLFPEK